MIALIAGNKKEADTVLPVLRAEGDQVRVVESYGDVTGMTFDAICLVGSLSADSRSWLLLQACRKASRPGALVRFLGC